MSKPIVTPSDLRVAIMVGMIVVILAGVKAASEILVPFILALFLAIVLNPLITLLGKLRVPRGIAITLVIVLIVMLLLTLITMLGSTLNDFARTLPQYSGMMFEKLRELQQSAGRVNIDISAEELVKLLDPSLAMNFVTRLLSHLSGALMGIFILLMTVVFMLFEVPQIPNKLQQTLEEPHKGMAAIQRALDSVTQYLVIKTVVSVVTGLVIWVMLALLGIRFAFLWGMLAFALNYIPNIGSVIAAVPAIIQALLFNGFSEGLAVACGYIAVNLLFGNILEPRVMGRGLGLSTLVVFMSLIFWGWLLGPIGMLLSVPLTIVVKIALEQTEGGQKFAIILGDGKIRV
jgi:AI-2 transport protein TqsA